MKTLNEMAEQSGLRQDLIDALEYGKERNTVITSEWIYAIDPENMELLKSISKMADGNYSLITLAMSIIRGKKIKLAA
jgi:hypothetical protein